jgi:hypothetical protein
MNGCLKCLRKFLTYLVRPYEWELESPREYHYLKWPWDDRRGPDTFDTSSLQKPQKFVAVLSHNYTAGAFTYII